MKIIRITQLAGFFILLIAVVAFAQSEIEKNDSPTASNQNSLIVGKPSTPFSLFDPSRLRMQHSYSVSFFSGGGQSQSIAMYMNQIDYQFARPLRLQVNLAYLHQPQSWFGASASSTLNNKILPSFRLLWEPSRNFHMSIGYEQWVPGIYNSSYSNYYNRSPYGRYGSPFD